MKLQHTIEINLSATVLYTQKQNIKMKSKWQVTVEIIVLVMYMYRSLEDMDKVRRRKRKCLQKGDYFNNGAMKRHKRECYLLWRATFRIQYKSFITEVRLYKNI